MSAPDAIHQLIDRFRANLDSYKRGQYNETLTRIEFINPFFKALGWDMDNERGYAEAYKDVVHEESIKVGGYTDNVGAPQTNLRISGERAKATLQELVNMGISANRMDAEGYGEQHPVADNATDQGRQKNRRVDIRVTAK